MGVPSVQDAEHPGSLSVCGIVGPPVCSLTLSFNYSLVFALMFLWRDYYVVKFVSDKNAFYTTLLKKLFPPVFYTICKVFVGFFLFYFKMNFTFYLVWQKICKEHRVPLWSSLSFP